GDEELIVHMDSEKDLIWQHAQELPIGDMAISKTLWNKQNLYVWIDVFDDNKHEDDKIHLFIDKNNDKSNNDQYKFDDSHYTFFRDDQSGADIDGVESIIKEEEWGYTLVASLPVSEGEFGKKIGFDIRVESSEGKEVTQFSWNDQTQQQENNPALLGELEYTNIAKQTMAIKGTPIIDSEIDVAWEKAHSIMTEQVIEGSSETKATAKTLWDEDYLYVLVEVNDSELDQKNQLAHEQDSIEIFMDENNQKTTSYQDDDAQYRINFENATSF